MPDVESYTSPEVALVFSAEHYPVLMVTWFGAPTEASVDAYAAWLNGFVERNEADDARFVIVGDTTGMTERPPPDVRRKMATVLDDFAQKNEGHLLGVITLVDGMLMRAIVKMTLLLTRQDIMVSPARSLEDALPKAFEILSEAGITPPPSLSVESYRRPDRPTG